MDVEPIKECQRFALALAAFLDLAPFFSDGVDFVANEGGVNMIPRFGSRLPYAFLLLLPRSAVPGFSRLFTNAAKMSTTWHDAEL
jgi:hypothetical protein